MNGKALIHLGISDYLIIIAYFAIVITISLSLKKKMSTGSEFFLSNRKIPGWITGLAFLSANLGASEIIGMSGSGYQYGMMTLHYYLIGAIPAMLFLGVYMMPFYYGSKIKSVPEYLKIRYNEATRGFNAVTFAVQTILFAGISLYALALLLNVLVGWSIHTSMWVAMLIVLFYVGLAGLTSSIYNEVLQFVIIWAGILPLTIMSLVNIGGISGFIAKIPPDMLHIWHGTSSVNGNGMKIEWLGIVLGLGYVLSFSYWTNDFTVVQRAMAAKDMNAARRTPIIASFFKMIAPLLCVIPGVAAIGLLPMLGPDSTVGGYDKVVPLLMNKYYSSGMLGLGITALLASFMSGMAGNITSFNTVWTYDIYQAYIHKEASEKHLLKMGRIVTAVAAFLSLGGAYIVMQFNSIMDYIQTLCGFFHAPIFAVCIIGMFWKKATPWGGFWGLICGTSSAFAMYILVPADHYGSAAAGNFWRAWWAYVFATLAVVVVSMFTSKKPVSELKNLVWSCTEIPKDINVPWYNKPARLAAVSLVLFIILNVVLF